LINIINYLYSRSTGYSFVATCSRVGGIVAPQLALLGDIAKHLPYTVNGVIAGLCALLLLLFDDKSSENLPDKLEEENE